jgi:hypothetical protein
MKSSVDLKDLVDLAGLIEHLKSEVAKAQMSDKEKMFKLGEVSITMKFVVKTSGKGGGKINLYAVTADAAGSIENQATHEISIKLMPKKDDIDLGEPDDEPS